MKRCSDPPHLISSYRISSIVLDRAMSHGHGTAAPAAWQAATGLLQGEADDAAARAAKAFLVLVLMLSALGVMQHSRLLGVQSALY